MSHDQRDALTSETSCSCARPPTRAVWKSTSGWAPQPRVGPAGGAFGIGRAAGESMTSSESAASVTRSAIRRLVLALISARHDAGRALRGQDQVDAERAPRRAMSTSPSTKSGSSAASAANSSMTITSRGIGASAGPAAGLVVLDVLGAGLGQQVLAPAQLGARATPARARSGGRRGR